MRTFAAVLLLTLAFGVAQHARAQAQEQRIAESIVINAPPDVVWEIAGDFVGLDRWYPFIESSKLVLGENRSEGAIRELRRLNGTRIEEKLIEYDPWNRCLQYTYMEGDPLSSDYFATLQVKDAGAGRSCVEWTARFKRLEYWTDAPAGAEEARLVKLLSGGYKAGLQNLKKLAEAQPR